MTKRIQIRKTITKSTQSPLKKDITTRSTRSVTRSAKPYSTYTRTITKKTKASPPVKKASPQNKSETQPTKSQPISSSQKKSKSLEVCLLMDCTGSMGSWIERSKNTLKGIIQSVKTDYENLNVKVSFVGYRDVQDKNRFDVFEFSEDLDAVTKFIAKMSANGGGDAPEDVQGGLNQALNMKWTPSSIKQLFLICDAPGHGKDICDSHDNHPKGSPDGLKIQDQMKEFAKRQICFSVIRVNNSVDKMIQVMRDNYDNDSIKLNVSDLEKSIATKSKEEVTKDFVTAASFILSAAVGGKKIAPKHNEPLWDPKKFAIGQYLSQSAYLTVKAIEGNKILVENQFGNLMHVSRDILEKMESASHFAKEQPMNMTELAELLENCGDNVFTVSFKKQVNHERVQEKLLETNIKELKDKIFLSQFTKELIEGEECTMVCHLIKSESSLGRSTVIDLTTTHANKFRQVDHRSINFLITQNVKYVLKKGGKKQPKASESDDEMDGEDKKKKKEEPKWDYTQLAVGNTFSGTSYFRAASESGDFVTTRCQSKDVTVSRDILETQMYNASAFASEEKLCLTKVAKLLEEANTACFTVCFTSKVDEKAVKERLSSIKPKEIKDRTAVRNLAHEILEGKETTIVGRLSKASGKLGRSLIIDLPTQGYRLVDHRTLKWLILKNVKYVVSK